MNKISYLLMFGMFVAFFGVMGAFFSCDLNKTFSSSEAFWAENRLIIISLISITPIIFKMVLFVYHVVFGMKKPETPTSKSTI